MPLLTEEEANEYKRNRILGPKRVQVGDESTEQPPVSEMIEALNYVQGEDAVDAERSGLRFFQFVPPGAG